MRPIFIYFLLVAFSLLLSSSLRGQDPAKIDSLLNQLNKEKNDSNKVRLFISLLYEHIYFKQEEGLEYAAPALALAEKLKWQNAIVTIKGTQGTIYWRMGNFDQALKYHFEALRISIENDDEKLIAFLYRSIGQDYADGGRYPQALIYFNKELMKYKELGDKVGMADAYLLLAWVYDNQGNYVESSKCNYACLKIYEELNDNNGIAIAVANLALDYLNLGNYTEALKYSFKSIVLLQKESDKINTANSYNQVGNIYKILGNYSDAIKYHFAALHAAREMNDKTIIAIALTGIGEVYKTQRKYQEALNYYLKAVDYFIAVSNKQDLAKLFSNIGICYSYLNNYQLAGKYFDMSLSLSKELNSKVPFLDYYHGKELLDSATKNWESAYRNYKQYILIRDSTFNLENSNKMLASQMQYQVEKKDAATKAEQEKKDIKQRNIRNSITAGLAGAIVFLVVVYRQRNKIKIGKKRSDELLLNILPGEVAEELKAKGSADAKHFNEVTVMFTDFKGFTKISEKLTPAELVAEIHNCFKAFDDIISKHNIEKIKTIGDAYMCVGGLPVQNQTHAQDVVTAALEILKFMQQHQEQRIKEGRDIFEIRIGIHTGPVVAGIVGVKKFAYDIWGDTVNIASRMESSGEAGKVNISVSTFELVKEKFNCTYRGKIEAKHKGEIDMYFVSRSFSEG